jgi:hypothetical protein
MPSSTSSSDNDRVYSTSVHKRAVVVFLGIIIVACGALEIGTRSFIYSLSKSLNRINSELHIAENLDRSASPPKTALITGNSLLMSSVNIEEANRHLLPNWRLIRLAIEQTTYYDWYFGLRKLISSGARPNVIIVCLSTKQLLDSGILPEFLPQYLLKKSDIMLAGSLLHLTPTENVDLLFANVSVYYALRKEIRKNILVKFMPEFPKLTALITVWPRIQVQNSDILSTGKERLQALQAITQQGGSKFIFMLMPPVDISQVKAFREIQREFAIPVAVPLTNDELDRASLESDGFHLNLRGQRIFTHKMSLLLKDMLD